MSQSEQEFRRRLMETFQAEAEEYIQGIISGMSLIEASLDDSRPAELPLIESCYRQFHSLKGASQAIGFDNIGKICQAAESILSVWKQDQSRINRAEIAEVINHALRTANELNITVPDTGTITAEAAAAPAPSAPPEPQPTASQTEAPPASQSTAAKDAKPAPAPKQDSAQIIGNLSASPAKPASETIRIASDKLDSLLRRGEQLVLARLNSRMRWNEAQELLNRVSLFRRHMEQEENSDFTSELDGEDMRYFISDLQRHVRNLAADHHELNAQLQALLDEVKRARLAPVRPLLEELEMAARRIARQLNKRVRITVEGTELELDRSIMEALKDPLIHLVRNALDHGLEKAEERRKQGKPSEGHLTLAVYSRGTGTMEFRVSDDGRGIQTEDVITAAKRQGLIADGVEADYLDLIFSSGVSTRQEVTDLSGRGLGMAIVREKVEALKGSVRVQTKIGEGTTFILSVPTSLATFDGLLVSERGRQLVFPLNGVEAVTQFRQKDIRSVEGSQVVSFRGSITPVSHLGDIIGIPAIPGTDSPDAAPAVVVSAGGRKATFLVDKVFGAHEVLSRSLGPQLKKVRFIIGACMIDYKQAIPVLNVADLLTHIRGGTRAVTPQTSRKSKAPHVLIVDDSSTTRTLMRSLLEGANYNVKAAADGAQAWDLVQKEDFDLVISDVDMPGMTGFDLVVKVRSNQRLKHLPLILVTGQEHNDDRQRGLQLGASAYLNKSEFDEGVLLESVERLVGEA